MSPADVPEDAMNQLTDTDIEALLSGQPTEGAPSGLTTFVADLRSEYSATHEVAASTALAEFLDVIDLTDAPHQTSSVSGRGVKAVSALGAFVATTAGKIVLGTAVAAASIGGAHAAELVDVPLLPEVSNTPAVITSEIPFDEPVAPTDDEPEPTTNRPVEIVESTRPEAGGPSIEPRRATAGVDGESVADSATSGTPQDQGVDFGRAVADDAARDLPAEPDQANDGTPPRAEPARPDRGNGNGSTPLPT